MPEPTQFGSPSSPCCGASIDASRGDGVWIGSCSACGANVIRINPRTGRQEWLDGASPWTTRSLRSAEQPNPDGIQR